MTKNTYILLAAAGSAALLIGAYGFQLLGYAPCKMCLWQRWPHGAAILIGVLALLLPVARLPLILLGALAASTTGAIGVFHAGVEQGWWDGPTTCTSGAIGGLSTEELMNQILTAPLVRCDEIAWQLFGLSMAGWNALISFAFVALWIKALLVPASASSR